MQDPATLAIGTRASPLALAQAHEARDRIAASPGWPGEHLTLHPMTSTGDKILNSSLADAGGKGLFTKELDEALLAGSIDLAVHSAKDLPTRLPDGLAIAGYLPREDVRDAFICRVSPTLAALPAGAVIGSASLRRQAMVMRLRPDLRVALLRGNVGTRLGRLAAGEFQATLLALAGLKRLGLADQVTEILPADTFCPAVGQGAIAIVTRTGDERVLERLGRCLDGPTGEALAAERAFLAVLDGSCRTPIGGHAVLADGQIAFRGIVLTPDGSQAVDVEMSGPASDAARLGHAAGLDLRSRLPAGWSAQ